MLGSGGSAVCGVDWPKREMRFETVIHLYSIPHNHRLRIKVPLPGR